VADNSRMTASLAGWCDVIAAEALKQHRTYFHSSLVYVSNFFMPLLHLLAAYYMFMPFQGVRMAREAGLVNDGPAIFLFLLLGFLGYTFFMALLLSAWRLSWERFSGTLELFFLTPASRLGFVSGNALFSLAENGWAFAVFTGVILWVNRGGATGSVPLILAGVVVLALAATAWGTFLNVLFIMTRDSGFFFTILDEPMSFFSGVRIPPGIFPAWAKVIGFFFPLTYCLRALRAVVLGMESQATAIAWLGAGLLLSVVLFALAAVLIGVVERHAKRAGTLHMF